MRLRAGRKQTEAPVPRPGRVGDAAVAASRWSLLLKAQRVRSTLSCVKIRQPGKGNGYTRGQQQISTENGHQKGLWPWQARKQPQRHQWPPGQDCHCNECWLGLRHVVTSVPGPNTLPQDQHNHQRLSAPETARRSALSPKIPRRFGHGVLTCPSVAIPVKRLRKERV